VQDFFTSILKKMKAGQTKVQPAVIAGIPDNAAQPDY
jgi:hypothetical protein